MAEPTNGDIMQAIGQLQGNFSGVLERLDRADESRTKLYEKLDKQGDQINEVTFAVKVAADIAAQARDRVAQVAADNTARIEANKVEWTKGIEEIEAKLEPIVDQWRKANTIGKFVVALLALGGVSFIGTAIWAGNIITEAVRHWLHINS